MTIIYNKNAPDYYLVSGLEEGPKGRTPGQKTRNITGDFIIISSEGDVGNPGPQGFDNMLKILKKATFILLLIALVPFSSILSIGYLHLLISGEVN